MTLREQEQRFWLLNAWVLVDRVVVFPIGPSWVWWNGKSGATAMEPSPMLWGNHN